jgi:hypothetical protein
MADFTSNANKGSVWNLLYQEGVFNSLGSNLVPQVKAKFDQIFFQIDKESGDTFTKNKIVIRTLIEELNKMRIDQTQPMLERSYDQSPPTRVTAEEISEHRREQFGQGLQEKQNEFQSLMAAPKPKDVDFSDPNDDKPIGENMDKMLEDIMKRREMQIENVVSKHDTKQAEEWLSNGGAAPIKLQIGEEIRPQEKRVAFADEMPSNQESEDLNHIFAAFKKKERDTKDIIADIKRLHLEAQERLNQIVELFKELDVTARK